MTGTYCPLLRMVERLVNVHAATGSSDLFEKIRELIAKHFDARRLFKLA
jgi:hypothetical protein